MKPIIILFSLILLLANNIEAQTFKHDITESLAEANDLDKSVLMIFSGSDWCKPCIKLRKTIIESSEFVDFANEKLILLELDFPYKKKNKLSQEQKKHNDMLADKYNEEGSFPKVIVLDKKENVIGKIAYHANMTTEEFTDNLTSIINSNK